MRFRSIRAFTALAVLLGAAATMDSVAVRPVPLANSDALVTPSFVPLGVGNQTTTVVIQLVGDPVAVQQENAGRKLTKQEKDQIKAQLRSQQNALQAAIQGLGGSVVATYQASYNGMKVRIRRDKSDQLATLPGVVAVNPLQLIRKENTRSVPMIGAPTVWQDFGYHGEGVKVAIIDTGIDYTHANFGGPGTVAAYTTAHAAETAPANPAYFGPAAPRVKGGIDLAGDSYNPDSNSPAFQPVPMPDSNPLDCNGHGSHVAGSAAGSGVTAAGATYTGPYNGTTISSNSWRIGPGVAPKADLYAVRVFGCDGPTDLVLDAIDWAVDNDMDVINMSLGGDFGTKTDPSAVAATNAAKAGVIVVASSGNSGFSPYMTGSPASGDGAVSVAANDPGQGFPGATMTMPTGAPITVINANNYAFPGAVSYTIKVIVNNPATPQDESLGCSVADFGGPLPPNTIAVVNRGNCARVAKAIFGQQAGAAAVVMVNTDGTLPPFEGPITSNPDDGVPFTVTIPFLGARGPATTPTSNGGRLRAANANGFVTTVTPVFIPNAAYTAVASFSSAGPRTGDSNLKPEVTAPGVAIVSTAVGSGNGAATISGTSMASPHVAGVAALTRQAHPSWKVEDIKLAIVNTGLPSAIAGYKTSQAGTGLVQPAKSTKTQVVAKGEDKFSAALNFGFEEPKGDFSKSQTITLRNNGSGNARFNVGQANAAGSPHTVSFNKTTVNVPAHGDVDVKVTLNVAASSAGASNEGGASFHEVAGLVEFTPASASDNGGVTLRVPYYLVPRVQSDISTDIGRLKGTNPSTVATVTNKKGAIAGDADFYAWGLEDKKNPGKVSNDVRAVGTQSFPFPSAADPNRQLLVFAVNTFDRWSNASTNEFDIYVDVDGDGIDDYIVIGVDQGAVQAGEFNGVLGSFVFSTRSAGASIAFLASAPTDSSTALLPVLSSQLCRASEPCLSAANPRITYHAVAFDLLNGGVDEVKGIAKYNVWSSAITTGGFATVAPGGTDSSNTISVNTAEWALTPALGLMVVSIDNKSGDSEAQLIKVDPK